MSAPTSPVAALLEPGYCLDRYELLAKIGQGGMASVWLARTGETEQDFFAIKTILPEHTGDEVLRKMMLDEAQIAMGIHHPNVARTLEVGQLFEMPYLVLEYVPGESLDQLCKALEKAGTTMPPAIAVRLVVDTCRGLHAAHRLADAEGRPLAIVHRDLSPHNILVDDNGHVRLIDFGIAKANARLTETASGLTKGKIPYMAPEQALGGFVDHRADLWSLGAVLYVLLTGTAPFDGANDATRLMAKLSGDPPEPLPERVPTPLRAVVDRTLSFYREARHASAEELADALAEAVTPATAAEVAKYFAVNLGAAIKARRRIVEHALSAARARNRARELLNVATTPAAWRTTRPRPMPPALASAARAEPALRLSQPPRPWLAYVSAAAIAAVILLAYLLGTTTTKRAALPPAQRDDDASIAISPRAPLRLPNAPPSRPLPIPPPPPPPAAASASGLPTARPSIPSAHAPPPPPIARPSASPVVPLPSENVPEDTIF